MKTNFKFLNQFGKMSGFITLLILLTSQLQAAFAVSSGGETGNGGNGMSSLVQGIAGRAVGEVERICRNHPELSAHIACTQIDAVHKQLHQIAWKTEPHVYLCENGKVISGDKEDVSRRLQNDSYCTERDAVNFGKWKNRSEQYEILVSETRYESYMNQRETTAPVYIQNLIHEVLGIFELEKSDSYESSREWIALLKSQSRLARVYDASIDVEVVPVSLETSFDEKTEKRISESLAKLGYAKPAQKEHALYTLKVSKTAVSQIFFDRSQDFEITVSLERLTDAGLVQVLKTERFRYNSRLKTAAIPEENLSNLLKWVESGGVPKGMK